MEERHPKHGLVGEHVERVEIMVERVATLNADEGRMLARGSGRAELSGVPNVPHPRRLIEQFPKGSEVLLEHLPAAPRSAPPLSGEAPRERQEWLQRRLRRNGSKGGTSQEW